MIADAGRRHDRPDDGFTLVELLVTLILISIVSVIGFNFLVSVDSTTTRASRDVAAETDAHFTLRQLSQDVRAAQSISATYPATSATSTCPASASFASPSFAGYKNCLNFLIYRPTTATSTTCPYTDVTYGLNGGVLRMDRTEYRVVSGVCTLFKTTTAATKMIGLVNTTGQPLFTYYDASGNDMLALGTPTNPAGARSIKITMNDRYQKNATDLLLTTSVSLRNQR